MRACVRAKLRERGRPDEFVGGGPASLGGKNVKMQSQPFELQIGLSCLKERGKTFAVVVPAGRLDVE